MLEARDLSCVRGSRLLFSALNFTADAGRVLLIEGANGSGKTSLLRILCGLRMPDAGQLLWDGIDVADLGSAYFRDVAYIGHSNGNKDDLTVRENLQFAQRLATASAGVEEALAATGLSDFRDAPLRSLSAGQNRRVALARLLCTRCRLWLLDEPFTSLDRSYIRLFETAIETHVLQGGSVVMTSHHDVALPEGIVQKIVLRA